MSTNAGAAGVFGILLCGITEIEPLLEELQGYIMSDAHRSQQFNEPDDDPYIDEHFVPRFAEALRSIGIVVPDSADLLWTGEEDTRPARCDTPSETWVLGFGLFTKPTDHPELPTSFLENAMWHTWAWVG